MDCSEQEEVEASFCQGDSQNRVNFERKSNFKIMYDIKTLHFDHHVRLAFSFPWGDHMLKARILQMGSFEQEEVKANFPPGDSQNKVNFERKSNLKYDQKTSF